MCPVGRIPPAAVRRARFLALGLILFGASAAAIAARRPDVFTRPQFWAEDGLEWYKRAYDTPGLATLIKPYGGYLQTLPRLAGLASQWVELVSAPLLMALLALLVQAIAPLFLLSDRFAWAVPGRARRLVLAVGLVAVPNLMEVHVNVSNSQVHLAFLACLVLLAEPRRSAAWRTFDVSCLLLSGLSGPFCILLLPVAALCWWHHRDRWSAIRLLCVLGPAVLQAAILSSYRVAPSLLSMASVSTARSPTTTRGVSLENLLDILGGQIFTAGLTGIWTYAGLQAGVFARQPWLPAAIGVAGLVFVGRAAWVTTNVALRALLLFAALHLAAGLTSPIILGDKPSWELLQIPGAGQRYYYSSILAFLATILWTAAADSRRAMRGLAVVLLAILVVVGIRGDWHLPPFRDLDFPGQAQRFAAAAPGESVWLHIQPEPFDMNLVRR